MSEAVKTEDPFSVIEPPQLREAARLLVEGRKRLPQDGAPFTGPSDAQDYAPFEAGAMLVIDVLLRIGGAR